MRRGGVAVDRFHLLCHKSTPLCLVHLIKEKVLQADDGAQACQ
jgi:hypothetical protein